MKPSLTGSQNSASASTSTTSHPQRRIPDLQFSISPSIFIPFPGVPPITSSTIPGVTQTLDQTQKLRLILKNIHEQQNAVKANTIAMYNTESTKIISKATKEIASIVKDPKEEEEEAERQKKTNDEIMKSVFVREPGKKSEDFEWKVGDSWVSGVTEKSLKTNAVSSRDGAGDTIMGGTDFLPHLPKLKKRSEKIIREEVIHELIQNYWKAQKELKGYDNHSKTVVQHYESSLKRWLARQGGEGSGSGDSFGRPAQPMRFNSTGSYGSSAGASSNSGSGRTGGGVRFGSGDASAGSGVGAIPGLQRPVARMSSGDTTNSPGGMRKSSAGSGSPTVRFATDDSSSARFGGASPLSAGVLPKGGGVRFSEPATPISAGGVKKGSILKNRKVQSPADLSALRASSQMMDMDEDTTRRGSK